MYVYLVLLCVLHESHLYQHISCSCVMHMHTKGVFTLALQSGSRPLQFCSQCKQIFPEADKIGSVRSTYGRWIRVDPSTFNEHGGRCQVELRVSRHVQSNLQWRPPVRVGVTTKPRPSWGFGGLARFKANYMELCGTVHSM